MNSITIGSRTVGTAYPPFVIPEIGINHEGSVDKAEQLIAAAAAIGVECVKFQCHVMDDEMVPNDVVPGNAQESIWSIMSRCALDEEAERHLKRFAEERGLIYLSTPFSRAAVDRLNRMGVAAFKIGSGECNNYPLVEHIARFAKPVILSTGMNDVASVGPAVEILRRNRIPYALCHCTSVYPTPYDLVRLGALNDLRHAFPDAVLGLSDHSLGNYACFAAVALGASIVEKHFTISREWPGPDNVISIVPEELRDLQRGCQAIHQAAGGSKAILVEEAPTIAFAYASVVTTRAIRAGEMLGRDSVWVKRPGTGEIPAREYPAVLGRRAKRDVAADVILSWADME